MARPAGSVPLDGASAAALARLGMAGDAFEILAVIWGTVELERALEDLGELARPAGVAAPGAPSPAAATVDDPLLGARVVVIPGPDRATRLAIAEPSTEGRLAATLARHGEGPAGHYVLVTGTLAALRPTAAAAGVALGPSRRGPFGPSALVAIGPIGGPSLILVERHPAPRRRRGGTIAAMTDRQPIALRSATPHDAERIAALFTDEGYPAGPSDIVERLARFDSEHSRVIVADNGGEVLGFVAVHALPRFEHSDRIIRVMALVVDAGERGRGIGRLLMEEAERLGREVGAAFAEVTAGHHRPDARRLYEELGYDGTVAAYLRKRL